MDENNKCNFWFYDLIGLSENCVKIENVNSL